MSLQNEKFRNCVQFCSVISNQTFDQIIGNLSNKESKAITHQERPFLKRAVFFPTKRQWSLRHLSSKRGVHRTFWFLVKYEKLIVCEIMPHVRSHARAIMATTWFTAQSPLRRERSDSVHIQRTGPVRPVKFVALNYK